MASKAAEDGKASVQDMLASAKVTGFERRLTVLERHGGGFVGVGVESDAD